MNNQTPEKPPTGQPPQVPGRFGRSMMAWIVAIGVTLFLVMMIAKDGASRQELTVPQFWGYLNNGQIVGEITVHDGRIEGSLEKDTPGLPADHSEKFSVKYKYEANAQFDREMREAIALHEKASYKYRPPSWWEGLLANLLLMALVLQPQRRTM